MTRSTLTATKLLILAALCAGFFGYASAASAFTCTAVAGGGNWSSAATWSGCNSTIPQAGDDVVLNATSGNVVVDVASNSINSLDMTGYAGTLSGSQNITQLTLTNGTSVNVTLGGTITWTGALILDSLSSATTTLISNGKTLRNVSFGTLGSGSTGVYVIADNLTVSSAGTLTLTRGTLHVDGANDNSGLTHSWGAFNSSNSNARTLILGTSAITLTNTSISVWNTGLTTNLTVANNTSVVTLNGVSASFSSATQDWKGMSLVLSGRSTQTVAANGSTFANITRIGTVQNTDALTIGSAVTITGVFTLTGNSMSNRLLVTSGTLGTPVTITVNGSVVASNVDFRDIAAAGTASWDLSAIPGGSGDALGNSGITFTPSQTNYWVGNGGNWSGSTHWASTSGGIGGTGRVPLPHDDVRFDANSFTATGQTVIEDMPRAGRNIDWTGVTNFPSFTGAVSLESIYGSIIFTNTMRTISTYNIALSFEGRGSSTFTSAGNGVDSLYVNMIGGTLTLGDSVPTLQHGFTLSYGIFNANNFNIDSSRGFNISGTATRALLMGNGTWSTGDSYSSGWNCGSATNLTFNAGYSTITFNNPSSNSYTFSGCGLNYNNVTIAGSGSGPVIVSGNNTFNKFTINKPRTIKFTAGSTNTFNQFVAKGTSGNLITLQSSTPGTKYTLKQTSGFVSSDWMSITDSTATGGAGWFAGTNSTLSNSTGWQLLQGPQQRGLSLQNGKIQIKNGKVKFQFR